MCSLGTHAVAASGTYSCRAGHDLTRHAHAAVPPLDKIEVRRVARTGRGDKAHCDTGLPRAPRAADAVGIVGGGARQFVVDNGLQAGDV